MRVQTRSLDELLSASFERNKERVAVFDPRNGRRVDATVAVTYAQLGAEVRARGSRLLRLATQGSPSPFVVALVFKDVYELLVSLLGCLSVGLPFTVLDPSWPAQRLAFMVGTSGAKICVSDLDATVDGLRAVAVRMVQVGRTDETNEIEGEGPGPLFRARGTGLSAAAELAYINFTSGSTGRPKGIEHSWLELSTNILANLKLAVVDGSLAAGKPRNYLQLIPYFSDPSLRQLLVPLADGGAVTLVGDAANVGEWVRLGCAGHNHSHVTDVHIVPSLLDAFVEYVEAGPIKDQILIERINTVGEPLRKATAQRLLKLFPLLRLFNQYGVSELSGNLTSFHYNVDGSSVSNGHINGRSGGATEDAHADDGNGGLVPVGRMLPHVQYELLDEETHEILAMSGNKGILAVQVQGMASGYLGGGGGEEKAGGRWAELRPGGERAAVYFVTGDVLTRSGDGLFTFEGRRDHQVKVLGHRVELLEIECVLGAVEGVTGCVAVLSQQKHLVAYYVANNTGRDADTNERLDDDERALREAAKKQLPAHMIPKQFVRLAEFPRLPNGKIDRVALASASPTSNNSEETSVPSILSPIETIVATAYSSVLRCPHDDIGPNSNFFELGGNSLLFYQLSDLLFERFGARLSIAQLQKWPTVAEVARLLSKSALVKENDRLKRLEGPACNFLEPFPLQPLQIAYLFATMPASGDGDVPQAPIHDYLELECIGLNVGQLETSLNQLIERHALLRCVVVESEQGGMLQKVLGKVPYYQIAVHEPDDDGGVEKHLKSARAQMSHQSFDYSHFPCFDVRVTRGLCHDWLHISFSGMFIDAKSFEIVLRDWSLLYRGERLEPLTYTFQDYVDRRRSHQMDDSGTGAWNAQVAEDRKYWLDRIEKGFPGGPQLPLVAGSKKKRGDQPTFSRKTHTLPPTVLAALEALSSASGTSTNVTLVTVLADVLANYCSRKHFALNVTLNTRTPLHPNVHHLVGNFTSVSLLEFCFGESSLLAHRVAQTQSRFSSDLDHRLFNGLDVQRHLLSADGGSDDGQFQFPVVFTSLLQLDRNYKAGRLFNGAYTRTSYHITQTPGVWIDCKIYADGAGLVIEWDYLDHVLPETTVAEMHALYVRNVGRVASEGLGIGRDRLRPDYGHVTWPPTKDVASPSAARATLHELFFRQVDSRRGHLALIGSSEPQELTYGQLSRVVLAFRTLLTPARPEEDFVGVMLPKGPEQVVAVLAILSLGLAYVPIDVATPKSRLRSIVGQCKIRRVVVTATSSSKEADLFEPVHIDLAGLLTNNKIDDSSECEWIPGPASPESIAYVIFTSGTTGTPKGVAVSHAAAVNTILDMNTRCGVTASDRVLAISELHFDLSVYDIFGLLAVGGAVVFPPHECDREPSTWPSLIARHRVTLWNSVPAYAQMLVNYLQSQPANLQQTQIGLLDSLRWFWLSGDAIPLTLPGALKAVVAPVPSRVRVLSLGGATEAGIWSICYEVGEVSPEWTTIPYGKALHNQRVYVLDSHLEPCPVWVAGELYIGGAGLALGYWGHQQKTEDAFFNHPTTGERLYRTGDHGRYMEDGNIEFLGRLDDQVKVHGHRIELSEIKAVLLRQYLVTDAVVMLATNCNTGQQSAAQIRAFVIPRYFESKRTNNIEALYEYKKSQPGLRRSTAESVGHHRLEPRAQCPSTYFARKSYRVFGFDTPAHSLLVELLAQSPQLEGATALDTLECAFPNIYALGEFLSPLAQLREATPDGLPKYTYASAGSLYAVQVYLHVGEGAIGRLGAGVYYYDPVQHQLEFVNLTTDTHGDSTRFNLILVGKYSALEHVYGKSDTTNALIWLNVGYLLGALAATNVATTWTTPTLDAPRLSSLLGLDDDAEKVLLTVSWNPTGTTLQQLFQLQKPGTEKLKLLLSQKPKWAHKAETWFEETASGLREVTTCSDREQHLSDGVLSEDSAHISGSSTFGIYFVAQTPTEALNPDVLVKCGFRSQHLMVKAAQLGLGLCPLGGPRIPSAQESRSPASVVVVHALVGGTVNAAQLKCRHPSLLTIRTDEEWVSEYVNRFLATQLPKYMIPDGVLVLTTLKGRGRAWPLTSNGKLCTQTLNKMWDEWSQRLAHDESETANNNGSLPENADTEFLLSTVAQVLGLEKYNCTLNDNFFRLGGNSLNAVSLANKLSQHFAVRVNVRDVLSNPKLIRLYELLVGSSRLVSEMGGGCG